MIVGNMPMGIIESVGGAYSPGMMDLSASAYYSSSANVSHTANFITFFWTFDIPTFTGGSFYQPFVYNGTGAPLIATYVHASDAASTDDRNKITIQVFNSASGVIYQGRSDVDYCAATQKSLFFAYDATAGTVIFEIDGVTADDLTYPSRVAPTTGTLSTGASAQIVQLGEKSPGPAARYGFIGIDDSYQATPTDFFSGADPKELDQSGWTEFGAQPLFFNEFGTLTDNKGSAGNATANGTITGPT